jgi:hypothetical protein
VTPAKLCLRLGPPAAITVAARPPRRPREAARQARAWSGRVTAGGRREDLRPVSPTTGCACAQDALEPVLLARARGYGVGSIAFEHELTGFEPGAAEVTATG